MFSGVRERVHWERIGLLKLVSWVLQFTFALLWSLLSCFYACVIAITIIVID